MLFVEFRFLFFFLLVFGMHWLLRGRRARQGWLLVCSAYFYSCFFVGEPFAFAGKLLAGRFAELPDGWWFPFILLGSIMMDYVVGVRMADAPSPARRKHWLMVSLVVNLGVLSFFKYFNFFIGSAGEFLAWLGLPASPHTLQIILPYGISFYTFQSMSYSIDVYRGNLAAVRRFGDLAFFISFFPQLVAGPIVRAATFLPQVFAPRAWAQVDVRGALTLFAIGFIKKACVAEYAARQVDAFFAAPQTFETPSAWLGLLYYAVQIYCDFSGYSDMAIATARLLGYELTLNFDFPYFSRNIGEFWRRWHISLSTWLRDYLFIPLGGSRGSRWLTYRNLMLTMLLGGLWHGASWTFVCWGGLHGLALVAHRGLNEARPQARPWPAWFGVPLTFAWVCACWVFFRAGPVAAGPGQTETATGFNTAMQIFGQLTALAPAGPLRFDLIAWTILPLLIALHWINSRRWLTTWWRRIPAWAYALIAGVVVTLTTLFIPVKYKPFIYFQF